MERRKLQRGAASCLVLVASFIAVTTTTIAQTWQWNYVTQTPNAPPLNARSTVTIDRGQLRMQYTIPLQKRQVVIESCRVALTDVGNASTIHSQGRNFLLVQLKPARSAICASGPRAAVALPTDDERNVAGVIAAIGHSCCTRAAVAVARKTPAPNAAVPVPEASPLSSPEPLPGSVPSPAPTTLPAQIVTTNDWVERTGRSSFVRVQNTGARPLRLRGVTVTACRNASTGCGTAGGDFFVDPHATITVATITSVDSRTKPVFRYRYIAVHGKQTRARSGSSSNAAPPGVARVPAAQVNVAANDGPDVQAGTFAAPRLIKRGSSRLAIGVTGSALIRLMIAENGTPQEATIVTISDRRLTAAAIETAVSSTYLPATQNGKPVAAKYVATFSFDGEDPALAAIPVWKRSPAPLPISATPAAPPDATPQASPQIMPPPPTPPAQAQPMPAASPVPSILPSAQP